MKELKRLPGDTLQDNDCKHCDHQYYSSMGVCEYGYCYIRETSDKFIGCEVFEASAEPYYSRNLVGDTFNPVEALASEIEERDKRIVKLVNSLETMKKRYIQLEEKLNERFI